MIQVDESKLNRVDRLGLAYCRLNGYEWDEIIGPKPVGFDDLPAHSKKQFLFRKKQVSKSDYIGPAIRKIKSIIGPANVSRCWWLFELGRTEEEWLRWYFLQKD